MGARVVGESRHHSFLLGAACPRSLAGNAEGLHDDYGVDDSPRAKGAESHDPH